MVGVGLSAFGLTGQMDYILPDGALPANPTPSKRRTSTSKAFPANCQSRRIVPWLIDIQHNEEQFEKVDLLIGLAHMISKEVPTAVKPAMSNS